LRRNNPTKSLYHAGKAQGYADNRKKNKEHYDVPDEKRPSLKK